MRSAISLLTALLLALAICGCQINLAMREALPAQSGLRTVDADTSHSSDATYTTAGIHDSKPEEALESEVEQSAPPAQTVSGWKPTNSSEDAEPLASASFEEIGHDPPENPSDVLEVPPAPGVLDTETLHDTTTDLADGDDQPPVLELEDDAATTSDEADSEFPEDRYPIDLPTALRLAGAENWTVRLAYERVQEAWARYDKAKVMWLPSINAGLGYTKHDGQIQATTGQVIDVSRNSLFVGGGLGTGNAPLTGGSGGPARLFVDLSLADAIFEPLAERQLVTAARAGHASTFNATLLEAAEAYYELLGAQGLLAVETKNSGDAEDVLNLTDAFVVAGKGSEADTARVEVEASNRRQAVVGAEMELKVASAELARILQLDSDKLSPDLTLFSVDETPVPVELIDPEAPLPELVQIGLTTRPEIRVAQAAMEAACRRAQAERWRPFIPNLYLGVSSGGFGGDLNDDLSQLDGRSDIDVLAVWQAKNLGHGNKADIRRFESRFRQEHLKLYRVLDQVQTEVSQAYHRAEGYRRQLELAEENVRQAETSFERNIARIRGLEGLPLEALQAVQATAIARAQWVAAVTAYNKAQVRLLFAMGEPITLSPSS